MLQYSRKLKLSFREDVMKNFYQSKFCSPFLLRLRCTSLPQMSRMTGLSGIQARRRLGQWRNGQSATRIYREFRPLDEESEKISPPTFYDGLDGMFYTIDNDDDFEVHYAIDTGVSPGNGDFTFGMWLLDERTGGTNLEYMRYGDSVYRLHSDEPYKFFSIETGSAYSASGGNWLSMGPMISYTVYRC